MLEAMSHFSIEQFHHLQDIGRPPDRIHRARFSQSFSFMCLDKKLIALHLSSPEKFWLGLIKATGAADIGADPRFATRLGRAENYEALQEALRPVFARQIRSVWIERLEKEDVPFAAIYGVDEALQDPQFRHLGIAQEIRYPDGKTVTTIRRPVVFDGQRDNIETAPPPRLGADGAKLRTSTE